MKKLYTKILFIGHAPTHNLRIRTKFRYGENGENAYDLSCQGAHGKVKF
jgi:hypothetical protein